MSTKQGKTMMGEQGSKPWWKEPWPWILISGPAVAVVGCAITIILAVQNFGDQALVGGAAKRGLVVDRFDTKASDIVVSTGVGQRHVDDSSTEEKR